jgi:enediyne biosynthesis protein E4
MERHYSKAIHCYYRAIRPFPDEPSDTVMIVNPKLHPKQLLAAVILLILAAPAIADVSRTPLFSDITEQSGLQFQYRNGMSGEYYFPEIMGGGAAFLDYNQNGLLDIYLVQGGELGPDISPADRKQRDRLFRNDSYRDDEGHWQIRFTDVTAEAGLDAKGYGMGVAVADYTNNGYPDLYVMNFGDNQLWRNNGDGTFTEVAEAAGANDSRWSVSGSFADLNGDGWLDLYVVNYVDFGFSNHQVCRSAETSQRDYCSPSAYKPVSDSLFRNQGNGRFEDVSRSSGVSRVQGHGLGVTTSDFNNNGHVDVYVANDGSENFFWLNDGRFEFEDDAFFAGNAVNGDGMAEAGMGVDAADFNDSGADDIFITHLKMETNTLYRNDGSGLFDDVSSSVGLGSPSLRFTGFGTAWLDIENNGWLDLVAINGAVTRESERQKVGDAFPYGQGNQVFRNLGNGRFEEITEQAPSSFLEPLVGRGAAFGDINNNGRIDMLVVNIEGRAQLFLNEADRGHDWLGLRLMDNDGRRDMLGAVAYLLDDGKPSKRRRSRSDGSYASANDPRVVFGLGSSGGGARIVHVHWPDGSVEIFSGLGVNRYHDLRQGNGAKWSENAERGEESDDGTQ